MPASIEQTRFVTSPEAPPHLLFNFELRCMIDTSGDRISVCNSDGKEYFVVPHGTDHATISGIYTLVRDAKMEAVRDGEIVGMRLGFNAGVEHQKRQMVKAYAEQIGLVLPPSITQFLDATVKAIKEDCDTSEKHDFYVLFTPERK